GRRDQTYRRASPGGAGKETPGKRGVGAGTEPDGRSQDGRATAEAAEPSAPHGGEHSRPGCATEARVGSGSRRADAFPQLPGSPILAPGHTPRPRAGRPANGRIREGGELVPAVPAPRDTPRPARPRPHHGSARGTGEVRPEHSM